MKWSSFFFWLGLAVSVGAAAEPNDDSGGLRQYAIDMSGKVSEQVQAAAKEFDVFISGGHEYTDLRNTSTVTVSQVLGLTEGGVLTNSTDFGFNLRLPNFEKRWQLRFSTYDEDQEDRDMNQRIVRTTAREKDPGAALMFFRKLGLVKVTFQPRIELKNPLQTVYTLKFESAAEMGKYRLVPNLQFFADSTKGTGEYFSLNFVAKPIPLWEFSQQNEEEYDESGNAFSTKHGVTAGYKLSDTQGLGAAAVASSANHNFHMAAINLSTTYSQQFLKKILKFSISPVLGFAKTDNFKGKAGFVLNLGATF